ncbi:nitroimidazol reductase NimA-like FMN-containing flavoprotein (pyridoxamine 5'-phosphate oxidase superfamily) [Rhizobium leguminosarum]|nr:hypothetical protein [Rhizobium leguminosarum]
MLRVLKQLRFGHLACCKNGQPCVVPIYFAYAEGAIYSFSMAGRKVDWMRDGTLQVFIEVIDAEDTQNIFDSHDQTAFLAGDRQPYACN